MSSLLPPASTQLEFALEHALSAGVPIEAPAHTVWDPHHCPVELLPWLAWAVGVDEWDTNWPEHVKRQVIAAMPEIRRHRGTVWAVKMALRAAGFGDSELIEGMPAITYNGEQLFNGSDAYNGDVRWSHFRVLTELADDTTLKSNDSERARRLIHRAKNVRSVLNDLMFRVADVVDTVETPADDSSICVAQTISDDYQLTIRYNGRLTYGGETHHGRDAATVTIDAMSRFNGRLTYDAVANHAGSTRTSYSV